MLTHRHIDSLSALTPDQLPGLRAGDPIGYVFTGSKWVQVWMPGEVVANDAEAGIVTFRTDEYGISTLEYGTDDIAIWTDGIDRTFPLRKVARVHLTCTDVFTGAPYAYDGHAAAVLPLEVRKGRLVRPVAIDPMTLVYCAPGDVRVFRQERMDWPNPIGPAEQVGPDGMLIGPSDEYGRRALIEDARPIRMARVRTPTRVGEVAAYLPANYSAERRADGEVYILGRDNAGWTLDGYVIPRLASGLIFAEEVTPSDD